MGLFFACEHETQQETKNQENLKKQKTKKKLSKIIAKTAYTKISNFFV